MYTEPTLSVITGYYNKLQNLEDSIESILKQSFQSFELIIFDDCSTDGTYEKLLEISTTDSRIRLLRHEANIGFVKGLIEAIKVARGEYIAIHGSGDISLRDRLLKQKVFLDNHIGIGVVGCYYRNVKAGVEQSVFKNPNNDCFKEIIKRQNVFSHGEVMFRKSIYDKIGGYRDFFKFAQDRDLWCRFSLHTEYHVLEEILYERQHDDPNSVNNNKRKRVKQILFSDFAVQSLKHREKYGHDLVDLYSVEALGFRKRTVTTSNRLAYLGILDILEGEGEFSAEIYRLINSEAISYRKIIFVLLYNKLISKSLLKRIIKYLK